MEHKKCVPCVPEPSGFSPSALSLVTKIAKQTKIKKKELDVPQVFFTGKSEVDNSEDLTSAAGVPTNSLVVGQAAFILNAAPAGSTITAGAGAAGLPITLAAESDITDISVSATIDGIVPAYAGANGDTVGVLVFNIWVLVTPNAPPIYDKLIGFNVPIIAPIVPGTLVSKFGSVVNQRAVDVPAGTQLMATVSWKPTSSAAGNLSSTLSVTTVSIGMTLV